MPSTAAKVPSASSAHSAQLMSKLFADVFQAFLECSDEVQAVVRDMVAIYNSPDATFEERESAAETIAEALFFRSQQSDIGIDLDGEHADLAPGQIQDVLKQMEAEELDFGERVTRLLEAKKMSQDELAAALDLTPPAVAMIIARDCRPQRHTIERVATALSVPAEELWPRVREA